MVLFAVMAMRGRYSLRYDRVSGGNGFMDLNKDLAFFAQQFGGCDGLIESKGKWQFRGDMLKLEKIFWRMNNDKWKKVDLNQRFLVKKDSLIAFSIINNQLHLNSRPSKTL